MKGLGCLFSGLGMISGLLWELAGFVYYFNAYEGLAQFAGLLILPNLAIPLMTGAWGYWLWAFVSAALMLGGGILSNDRQPARGSGLRASREAQIQGLQRDYAYINAEVAPLLAEAERLRDIRQALARLGAAPDPRLNAAVKRQLGVEDTPFNTP